MSIIKRNGDYQKFDYKKAKQSVVNALENSGVATCNINKLRTTIDKATDKAIRRVITRKHDHRFITTDEIREEIEKQLMAVDYCVAKAYIIYPYINLKGVKSIGNAVNALHTC